MKKPTLRKKAQAKPVKRAKKPSVSLRGGVEAERYRCWFIWIMVGALFCMLAARAFTMQVQDPEAMTAEQKAQMLGGLAGSETGGLGVDSPDQVTVRERTQRYLEIDRRERAVRVLPLLQRVLVEMRAAVALELLHAKPQPVVLLLQLSDEKLGRASEVGAELFHPKRHNPTRLEVKQFEIRGPGPF